MLVRGERIVAVGSGIDAPMATELDASGAFVIPGGIDVHTHLDLPVGAVRSADDFESGTVAAACGGTTSIVDFAGAGRSSPEETLAEWHEKAAGRAVVDYGFHVTVTSVPEDPAVTHRLFRWLIQRGVPSVKMYMAYPERLMVDAESLAAAFAAGAQTGMLICVHAEDGAEVERRTARILAGGRTEPAELQEARPSEVEAMAVRQVARSVKDSGASAYIVHLSSEAGLREVLAACAGGADLLAETCPQYLYLTGRQLEGPGGIDYVCVPPLREQKDRDALWDGLVENVIQVVATDHCPFTRRDRRAGVKGTPDEGQQDFTQIPGGLPGIETRLSLVYQAVREERLSLERWVEVTATSPARIFGLSRSKGAIRPGMDADIVIFDPESRRDLRAERLHSRSDHSPYQDLDVVGWPAVTIARGRIVARDGEPATVEPGWGRFVNRKRFSGRV